MKKINFEANPRPEDIQILDDGIMDNARHKKGMDKIDSFAFFIRDDKGLIIGGCSGCKMYGSVYVGSLWVTEHLRGHGYGISLMQSAEEYAIKSNCKFIAVNTMDFEALNFYKKLGFYVKFERHGYDKESIFYFLRKDLGDK